ncbi:MAG: DNA methyltransferase [Microbacteriaceae bacterium]|nr:DNA methyltransferase [Microbacteriaceae bacterium]
MANKNLAVAKKAKNDEFYTQWADIEREMNAYLEYDHDVFRGKTLLLPCDDPEWSNFTKFFALHFADFGMKKLISTSYAPNSNAGAKYYQPTLFETESTEYDQSKSLEKGKVFVLEQKDINEDGKIDINDLQWSYLEGDGDFRSEEVTKLRDQSDIVITNPPFSLFREFVGWIFEGEKQFSIIGGKNAITYKEIFPLIQQNKLWLGKGFNKGDAYFRVPESAGFTYAAGVLDEETSTVHFRNIAWFTNIEHGRRHEPLKLMTMADNIKFSKHKEIRGKGYQYYDNFDAIEVPFVDAIPSDYTVEREMSKAQLESLKNQGFAFEILRERERERERESE